MKMSFNRFKKPNLSNSASQMLKSGDELDQRTHPNESNEQTINKHWGNLVLPLSSLYNHANEIDSSVAHVNCQKARQISFANKYRLNWKKENMHKNALLVQDIDGDGITEVIVGSLSGTLSIFKGVNKNPWKTCSSLGTIIGLLFGKLGNKDQKNCLLVICAEGVCYEFKDFSDSKDILPLRSSLIACNVNCSIIEDIDGDGKNELIIGSQDGDVYVYSYLNEFPVANENSGNDKNFGSFKSLPSSPSSLSPPATVEKSSSLDENNVRLSNSPKSNAPTSRPSNVSEVKSPTSMNINHLYLALHENGPSFLKFQRSWKFLTPVISLHVDQISSSSIDLVVANKKVTAENNTTEIKEEMKREETKTEIQNQETEEITLKTYSILLVGQLGMTLIPIDPNGSDQIIFHTVPRDWNFSPYWSRKINLSHSQEDMFVALSSGGGDILNLESEKQGWISISSAKKNLWEICFDHDWLGMELLDITGDGNEEIVVTSWDGMIFIINYKFQHVKFKFDESIAAFKTGMFCRDIEQPPKPSFVFVTHNDEIIIYCDVSMKSLSSPNLIDVLKENMQEFNLLKNSSDSSDWSRMELMSLFHSCLNFDFESNQIAKYKQELENQISKLHSENSNIEKNIQVKALNQTN